MTKILTILLLILPSTLLAGEAYKVLGSRMIKRNTDNAYIAIRNSAVRYDKLKLNLRGGNLILQGIKLHFANGKIHELPIKATLVAGSTSNPIVVPDEEAALTRITMMYKPLTTAKRATTVILMGQIKAK